MLSEIEKTHFDISAEESSTLIATSIFTIIPITYAFCNGAPFYGIISLGTATCSILYWIHPIHGWRRNLDLCYAKYSFIVYFGSGIWYIPYGYPAILFYAGSYAIFVTYYMTYLFPRNWIRFHVCFHILSILMKIYILQYIV